MKKSVSLCLLCIFSFIMVGCETSPDQTKEEIGIFLKGVGYTTVENIEVFNSSSFVSPCIKEGETEIFFDNIVIVSNDSSETFLLLIKSDGSFPEIVKKIQIN